jgi:hemerythrin-like metal-binding protein
MPDQTNRNPELEELDQQHERLLTLYESLIGALHSAPELMPSLFSETRATLVRHFASEESFLESIDYPELDGHRLSHGTLLSHLDRVVAQPAPSHDALLASRDAMVDHHHDTDADYIVFLAGRGRKRQSLNAAEPRRARK